MVLPGLPGPEKQVGRVLWPIGTIGALFLPGFKAQLARRRGPNAEGGIRLRGIKSRAKPRRSEGRRQKAECRMAEGRRPKPHMSECRRKNVECRVGVLGWSGWRDHLARHLGTKRRRAALAAVAQRTR